MVMFDKLCARDYLIVCFTFIVGLANAANEPTGKSAERLLVVAPKQFAPALEKFMQHKAKLLNATLKPLEEILAESKGVDDAEKLKRFLYEESKARGLDYVLLVGDIDVLPVRYMTLDRVHEPAFNYSMYPCD